MSRNSQTDPSSPVEQADPPSRRWLMLGIVSAGFIVMPLNWFNISTGFGAIGHEFQLAIPEVAFLISIFVAAYGLLHIPGGFLATHWGIRRTLAIGLGVEALGAFLSGTSTSYEMLVVWRVVAGSGASIFAAVGIAAVTAWFRHHRHALALGISSAAFSIGAALGLYAWAALTEATGWRGSLMIGGVVGAVVSIVSAAFFRVPQGADSLAGVRLTKEALRQSLGNREIWRFGLAFFGAYGAYLVASQFIAGYGLSRGIDAGQVAAAAFLIGIAGVPGSIAGGWLADRYSPRLLFVGGAALEALALALVPQFGSSVFWLPALGIGFMFNFCFAIWQTVPGSIRSIAPENIGTAVGLMLTISAVGGFVVPWAFGALAEGVGFPAAWTFLGVVSVVSLLAVLGPARASVPAAPGHEVAMAAPTEALEA